MKRKIIEVSCNYIQVEVKVTDNDKALIGKNGLTAGGLHLPDSVKSDHIKQVLHSTESGTVIAIGDDCFLHTRESKPRCAVGDHVLIIPYSGTLYHDETEDRWFRIIRDVEVIAKLSEEIE